LVQIDVALDPIPDETAEDIGRDSVQFHALASETLTASV
jgi:hypothetical protein